MPEYDKVMVERLARFLHADSYLGIGVTAEDIERVWNGQDRDEQPNYRAEAVRILTALSQDYAIVAKAEYEATEAALAKAIDVLGDKVVCPPQIVGNCYDYTDRDDCWMAYLKAPKEATPDA
jgi:chloramphenicol 3-O-phosphotransferase